MAGGRERKSGGGQMRGDGLIAFAARAFKIKGSVLFCSRRVLGGIEDRRRESASLGVKARSEALSERASERASERERGKLKSSWAFSPFPLFFF